jgi:hypothetical protein
MTKTEKKLGSVVNLDVERIQEVKKHMASEFGDIRPRHRLEIFARCIGFRAYLSLRDALKEGPVNVFQLDTADALQFCSLRGIDLTEEELYLSLEQLVAILDEAVYTPYK